MTEFLVCCQVVILLLAVSLGKWVGVMILLYVLNNLADRLCRLEKWRRTGRPPDCSNLKTFSFCQKPDSI